MLPTVDHPSGVYEIRNKVNGKRYIGSSVNLKRRFNSHHNTLKRSVHKNKHLQSAWEKYGKDNFEINILVYCSAKKATFYEQRCIDVYKPEYNKCPTASSMLGYVMPREKVEKHRALMRDIWSDDDFRAMMQRLHQDRLQCLTQEQRLQLSENGKKAWADHAVMKRKIKESRKSSKKPLKRLKNGSLELSEERSKITKGLWLDADYKKKQADGTSALWKSKKFSDRRRKEIAEVNRRVSKRKAQGKFTDEQVIEIRSKRKAGLKLKELSEKYGASEGNLSLICSGKLYDWIPLE